MRKLEAKGGMGGGEGGEERMADEIEFGPIGDVLLYISAHYF
jgi:hypothetical protein